MQIEFTTEEINLILNLMKQTSISPFQPDAQQALNLAQGIIAKLTQKKE